MDHTRDRDFLFFLLLLSEENGFFFFGAAETEQKSEIRDQIEDSVLWSQLLLQVATMAAWSTIKLMTCKLKRRTL